MDKQQKVWIGVSIAVILLFFVGGKGSTIGGAGSSSSGNIVQGEWDISEQVKANNMEQYLIEEIDFDYTHPELLAIAQRIKSDTATPYDAVKMTAKYVYDTIKYDSAVTINGCYQETASSTLALGRSDCVGMTRMNVALLRAMGIPARSVGGCLKASERCSPLFAVAPGVQAKVTPMQEGDFKKRGFLHEWVEVFSTTPDHPEGEWLSLEATSGQIFSKTACNQYITYAYDSNQYDRCTINDNQFWNLCSVS